jgi:putative ABC transport system permease protein
LFSLFFPSIIKYNKTKIKDKVSFLNSHIPPRWPLRLLKRFCPPHLYEEIEGDLIQKFEKDVKLFAERKAKRRLMWNTLRFFRPGIIFRSQKSVYLFDIAMLLNHIQFSLRHLGRKKVSTLIHVTGLTLGISVCLFVFLFLHQELSFDSYHKNADRIFRINSVWSESGKEFNMYATPTPLAQAIRSDLPGIKNVVRALPQFSSVIEINPSNRFKQERVLIVDPEFLDVFTIGVLSGDGHKALRTPFQALLSETTAHKFYGNENPIGKVFRFRNEFDITVAGVMRDLPSNTSLPATILLSYAENENFLNNGDTWYFGDFAWAKLQAITFVELEESTDPETVKKNLNKIAEKNINAAPNINKAIRGHLEIQPLKEIHFDNMQFGGGPWIKPIGTAWLWLFGVIGIVVLSLACINFLNLSVAQAITRAKEASIRKVIGARRSQLIVQFLTETCLLTLASGVLSILIVWLTLQPINLILERNFSPQLLQSPVVMVTLFASLLLLGFLAGLYPALMIARSKSTRSWKQDVISWRTSWLQNGLVVTQFTVSASLAIVVLLIARQVGYMNVKDLGLEKENILQVRLGGSEATPFVNQLRQRAGVKEVSLSRSAPISDDHWWNTISEDEKSVRQSVCAIYGDEHFYSVYGLTLLSGYIPAKSSDADSSITRVVVNEKLLQALNLGTPHEAVGKHFWWGNSVEIAGVVADFNSEPLHYAISPALIVQDASVYTQANIKLEPLHSSNVINEIEDVWKKNFPDGVYESKFLNEQINSFYRVESKFYSLLSLFAFLAIIISCLGLLGIVSFVTLRRVKEVSIRKVLGATASDILTLFVQQFLRPVTLACLAAVPVSWYAVDTILSNYAYSVKITWDLFVIPVTALIGISLIVISFQTVKTSLTNPADNLRGE